MKTPIEQKIKLRFPLHLYFQQLFTPNLYVKFINPFGFWRRYRINHLENCWEFNTVRYLENCHKIDWQPTHSRDNQSPSNLTAIGIYRGLLWEKNSKNTLLIVQPTIKLKYRGVTYRTNQIVGIEMEQIETKSQRITSNSSDQIITDFNNNYNSQPDSTIS